MILTGRVWIRENWGGIGIMGGKRAGRTGDEGTKCDPFLSGFFFLNDTTGQSGRMWPVGILLPVVACSNITVYMYRNIVNICTFASASFITMHLHSR